MATAVDELLDMLFDMIDEAKNAAFSSDKCVIDRDKALDIIEDAKKQLPVDLAEARKILNKRDEYLASAKREAEEIRKRAEIEANQMVSEAPVMTQARQKAREVLAHADEEAKKTCRETNEYCVDLLRRTEDALAAAHAEMRQVHNQFRTGMGGSAGSERPSGGSRMYDAEADG